MIPERDDPGGAAPAGIPLSGRAGAIVRTLLGGRALGTRLVVAGVLLAVGLPALTILVYVWGYPSNPIPLPLLVMIDVLQILIVLNAIVVVAQLVAGARVPWAFGRRRSPKEARQTSAPRPQRPALGLRELSLSLAEMIWEQERKGRAALGPAVVDYVRDAVTAELTYRRRMQVLEQRLASLELWPTGGSGANASDHVRP